MEKVEGSREMLEEMFKLPDGIEHLEIFAIRIGAAPAPQRHYIEGQREKYERLFRNCLDVINLRQQIEQCDVLSEQTLWIRWYTIATFALVVATCLIVIFR
jgi:hypothetical protein